MTSDKLKEQCSETNKSYQLNLLPNSRLLVSGPPGRGGGGEGVSDGRPDGRLLGGRQELAVPAPRGRPRRRREGIPDGLGCNSTERYIP